MLDVRIGVTQSVKEVILEMPADSKPEDIKGQVDAALAEDDSVLWLTDKRGKQVGVLAEKIAYVEIEPKFDKSVGFGA